MTPVVFEGCFGWLHPAAGRRGVVLCSAHGNEELSVHRTWRDLAERLAAAGLPTLRFDYRGTGDSIGSDEDPNQVRGWLDSVHAAVHHLRAATGVEEVALVGLRLGATLAAVAAAEMGGVARLILLAPCITGRAYAHELKAMAYLAGTPQPHPDAVVESAGYLLTSDTLAGLRGLDLMALPHSPAPRVLLLERTDVHDGARLTVRLRELGAAVEVEPFGTFAHLMNSVQRAAAPQEPLDAVTNWLRPDEPEPATPPLPAGPARLELPGAVETAVLFGPEQALFGMLCEPKTTTPGSGRPAVLLLNSGATHHVGSGGMSVYLARRLAAHGFASFRMDITGIGDSGSHADRRDNLLYCRDACADTRAALDWLAARGLGRCVAVGLCAGATLALHTTLEDERVVGQVLVNPGRFFLGHGETSEAVTQSAVKRTGDYVRMLTDGRIWRAVLRKGPKVARIAQALAARGLHAMRIEAGRVRAALGGGIRPAT
ncbi:MAG TPA: alpha/beta fold hydrolase [Azospirillum sp.]|nr:alpha/beta fold hydrolase [Azospirillum sp.]